MSLIAAPAEFVPAPTGASEMISSIFNTVDGLCSSTEQVYKEIRANNKNTLQHIQHQLDQKDLSDEVRLRLIDERSEIRKEDRQLAAQQGDEQRKNITLGIAGAVAISAVGVVGLLIAKNF